MDGSFRKAFKVVDTDVKLFPVCLPTRSEPGPLAEYKTKASLELESKGFRIGAVIGDQWSDDLRGQTLGKRVFKLPNMKNYS